jgi:hypothetical protein
LSLSAEQPERGSALAWSTEEFRQTKPGRPYKNTKYVKVENASFYLELGD